MLFSITDNKADDNPSLPRHVRFDVLSKFDVSEFSSTDTTGAVVSELCTDVTVFSAEVSDIIASGAKPTSASLFGCETVSNISLSEPSTDSFAFVLLRFFFTRSWRFFFSSSPDNECYSVYCLRQWNNKHSQSILWELLRHLQFTYTHWQNSHIQHIYPVSKCRPLLLLLQLRQKWTNLHNFHC